MQLWEVAQEIDYLSTLSRVACLDYVHLEVSSKLDNTNPPTDQIILSYRVPDNYTWIVTEVGLRTIPPVDDPDLTVMDWRSFDLDASGTGRARWFVNGKEVTSLNATYFSVFNRPLLLAFPGGVTVTIEVERSAAAVPATQEIVVAVNGYLTAPGALAIQSNTTIIVDVTDAVPPPIVGGMLMIVGASLIIFDTDTPATPSVLSNTPTVALPGGSETASGDQVSKVYLISGFGTEADNRLQVVDYSNPSAPSVDFTSGPFNRAGAGYRLGIVGNNLFIPTGNTGSSSQDTIRVWNTVSQTVTATYDTTVDFPVAQVGLYAAVYSGNLMFLINQDFAGNAKLCSYDISNPLAITQVDSETLTGIGDLTIEISGSNLFVFQAPDEIKSYSFNGAGNLTAISTLAGITGNAILSSNIDANGFMFLTGVLSTAGGVNIRIIDVSDPSAMVFVGSVNPATASGETIRNNFGLRTQGEKLYLFNNENLGPPQNRRLQIYDTSNAIAGALGFLGSVVYNPFGAQSTPIIG